MLLDHGARFGMKYTSKQPSIVYIYICICLQYKLTAFFIHTYIHVCVYKKPWEKIIPHCPNMFPMHLKRFFRLSAFFRENFLVSTTESWVGHDHRSPCWKIHHSPFFIAKRWCFESCENLKSIQPKHICAVNNYCISNIVPILHLKISK